MQTPQNEAHAYKALSTNYVICFIAVFVRVCIRFYVVATQSALDNGLL